MTIDIGKCKRCKYWNGTSCNITMCVKERGEKMNKYQEALARVRFDFKDRVKTDNILMVGRIDIDILQELVDKQTPKKPIIKTDYMFYELEMYEYVYLICPNCKSKISDDSVDIISNNKDYYTKDYYNQDINFCHCCGQKLDWSLLDEIFCKEVKE